MSFNVGDKVKHEYNGAGEIVYGPFTYGGVPSFLMKLSDGDHEVVSEPYLTPAPAFAVGDKVLYDDMTAEITYGPYKNIYGVSRYVIRFNDGHETATGETYLSPLSAPMKVGDKIRITEDEHCGAAVMDGDVFTVTDVYVGGFGTTGGWGFALNRENNGWERIAADTETYNGITYDLSARYKDTEGDYWTFKRIDGVVRGGCDSDLVTSTNIELSMVVADYGPLTRV